LAIVSEGRAKFQGAVEELQCASEPVLEIEADQLEQAADLLTASGLKVRVAEHRLQVHSSSTYSAAQLNALLVRAGIGISHLSTRRPTLEEVFLNLTRNGSPTTEVQSALCS
jgi:ABC-type multidrug transport system ATPase subunit